MWNYELAWLSFMLADIPRLGFRLFSRKRPFNTAHRTKKFSPLRVVVQTLLQNILYLVALGILYYAASDLTFLLLGLGYAGLLVVKCVHQVKRKRAYVTDPVGHAMNDFVIKPFRMSALIFAAVRTGQPIWLIGFGLVFVKWILTIFYERVFDVPNWYHTILVSLSAALVLLVFPLGLGTVKNESLTPFLTAVPSVYAAYVGLLAVFLTIVLGEHKQSSSGEGKRQGDYEILRRYFVGGMILNFSYSSALIVLCLFGLFLFGGEPLGMRAQDLFHFNSIGWLEGKRYTMFGVVVSLTWLLFFFTIMTAYLMLLQTGGFIPRFWKQRKQTEIRGQGTSGRIS